MKRVGNLFPAVTDFQSLCAAARRAAKGHRSKKSAASLLFHLETEVLALQRELLDRTYRPRSYRTFSVRDPKPRTISAADIRDRVVHHALCAVLEPVFERVAIPASFACRKGKGSHKAVARAQMLARRFRYFLKLDVRHFFETVSHEVLKRQIRRVVKDPGILWLCDLFIAHGAPGSEPGRGLPIGNLTSQHFANFYLAPLDHFIQEELRVGGYIRYMDDLLLFADSKVELRRHRLAIARFLRDRLDLSLKDEVTVLAPVTEGIPYLGLRVFPGTIRWSAASKRRFCRRVRERLAGWKTGRLDERAVTDALNSMIAHAAHADTVAFRRKFFENLDGGPVATPARTG